MKLEQVQWSEAAERGLSKVLGTDRDAIAADVRAGRHQLWKVDDGESWMVTTVDAATRELIVCCFQGSKLRQHQDALYAIAQRNDLRGVRWFSESPAFARYFRAYPVKCIGYVYRVEVSPRVA